MNAVEKWEALERMSEGRVRLATFVGILALFEDVAANKEDRAAVRGLARFYDGRTTEADLDRLIGTAEVFVRSGRRRGVLRGAS